MTTKNKKRPAKKRARKRKAKKRSFLAVFRQWSFPLILMLLVGFSLAATFYIIFLHTPTKPLF
jgi:hypothetical protein